MFCSVIFANKSISKDNDLNSIVKKMCLLGFNSEMKLAKITPPVGMSEFTCNCFVKKVSYGYSLELAQEECKMQATKKFNM
tara:strand:+ start:1529 stop:1771 length:243 start_codon:yes stop_codon:yes gene_type:complete